MCLEKITKIYKKPDPKERVGWKLVSYISIDKTHFDSSCVNKTYKTNRWLKSSGSWSFDYPIGFHIFEKKKDAKEIIKNSVVFQNDELVKVKYRKTVARGIESMGGQKSNCIVAKEMKVIV